MHHSYLSLPAGGRTPLGGLSALRSLLGLLSSLLLGLCLPSTSGYGQDVLWGMTSNFGPAGAGTAFSLQSTGAGFTVHKAFANPPPVNPYGSLVEGSDGNFYGMAYGGGLRGYGTVFKMTPAGELTVLKHLDRPLMEPTRWGV